MLHHIAFSAKDLVRSGNFYDVVFKPLGYIRHITSEDLCAWNGSSPEILIYKCKPDQSERAHQTYDPGIHHVAFEVTDRDVVDDVYKRLLEVDAEVLDKPKEYPHYCKGYYAVFFLDPDGIKLEVAVTPFGLE